MKTTNVTTIKNLLAAGRIVEAKAMLIPGERSQLSDELRQYSSEIERRLIRARALVTQAATMERAGKIDEAKALYESVLPIAADFPGITEHLNRMDEVLQLTRAVQRRSKRLRHSRSTQTGKADSKKPWIIWTVLGTGVVTVALLLAVTMPWPPWPATEKKRIEATPPADTAPPAVVAPPTPPAQDKPPIPVKSQSPVATAKQAEPHRPPPAPDKAPAHDPLPQHPEEPPSSVSDVPRPSHAPVPKPEPLVPATPQIPATPQVSAAPQVPVTPKVPAAAPTSNQPAYRFYTVRQADSLSSIARNELCNETAWQQIYQLNRDRITDPDLVLPGMVLRLTGLENRCHPARQ